MSESHISSFELSAALAEYLRRHASEHAVVGRFESLLAEHSDCFDRSCWAGHITGSAWITDPAGHRVMLTHHRKLDRWLQPGGHSDGDPNTLGVALREAEEETGLTVQPADAAIFDLDVHSIPARGQEPEHFHFDVRFALIAETVDYTVSEESHDLAWVAIDAIGDYSNEESLLRMAEKWRAR